MAFTPQFLDDLKGRLTLSDYVGKRVRLQKKGREHLGLCPFHNEKTPSFTVNNDKAFYHCFGCGAHGSVIDWAMHSEGLSFPEAVERLANDAGVQVPQSSPRERARAERARTLLDANEAACRWFEKQLQGAAGREALAYLHRRGLTEETIARFRLGYAPDQRDGLQKALAAQDLPRNLVIEAGLAADPDDGRAPYDRFRGRVIFPITDRRGRVIAFGGRLLADRDGVAKYLNSPETPVFQKGSTLYALALAREAAANDSDVLVTEGYMDVIALHQAGFDGAVAPLGTAITERQIEALWRLAPEPVLCLDGDTAGGRAAARAATRALPLLKPGLSLRFATLPPGEDPDSLVQVQGAAAFAAILAAARPLVDVVWDMETVQKPQDTPERRALIRKNLRDHVGTIGDASVRDSYWVEIDRRLGELFARRGDGQGRVNVQGRHRPGGRPGPGRGNAAETGLRSDGNTGVLDLRARQALLATAVNHPELLDDIEEALALLDLSSGQRDPGQATRSDLDRLRQEILTIPRVDLDSASIRAHLLSRGFSAILDKLLSREVYDLAPFAAPDATPDVALDGWRALSASLLERQTMERDLREAERALAADVTEQNWAHLNALTEARRTAGRNGDS